MVSLGTLLRKEGADDGVVDVPNKVEHLRHLGMDVAREDTPEVQVAGFELIPAAMVQELHLLHPVILPPGIPALQIHLQARLEALDDFRLGQRTVHDRSAARAKMKAVWAIKVGVVHACVTKRGEVAKGGIAREGSELPTILPGHLRLGDVVVDRHGRLVIMAKAQRVLAEAIDGVEEIFEVCACNLRYEAEGQLVFGKD
mmetsp:Transcript_149807/g.363892  ORF Transcript_149807/g.363892 Transcript_149807/m.363892 type:complete len:200 (-) Transcript_149807:324-923(-)